MTPEKELVLIGVYVADAHAAAEHYQSRLQMRRLSHARLDDDRSTSVGVVLAGSDKPPWLGLFSGTGPDSTAAALLGERPPGIHRLVYVTESYDDDLAWLRRRGLGFESTVPIDGPRALRRVSATLRELGVIVDLIERPPLELDDDAWRRALLDALLRARRPHASTESARPHIEPASPAVPTVPAAPSPPRGVLLLPPDAPLAHWIERIVHHAWSPACRAVAGGRLAPELAEVVKGIHARGLAAYEADQRTGRAHLLASGLHARIGESIGGPHAVAPSPVPISRTVAESLRRSAVQRASALRAWLDDLYAQRPTPVPEAVIASNPFLYVRADWPLPRPSGLAQYLAEAILDASSGAPVLLNDKVDSGRCGLANLRALRGHTERAHRGLLDRLGVQPSDDATALLRSTVLTYAPASGASGRDRAPVAAIAYTRDAPPFDLPHWEDLLMAKSLAFPRVAESDLVVRDTGLYMNDASGKPVRVDVLLHRRPATLYRFARWTNLVRAGKLAIVDPVNSALCNDRALAAFTPALIGHYLGESPRASALEASMLLDPDRRREILATPRDYTFAQRGGKSGQRVLDGAALNDLSRAALRAAIEDDPARWVAQRRASAASSLFFDVLDGQLHVWEGTATIQVFVLVGTEAIAPNTMTARVIPVSGAGEPMVADVLICETIEEPLPC